ncbi:MAG: hypothetical protein J7M18_03605 [Candidatus Eremiobacteraeota bacterium]|nr:hypothetical protein [Candidatus Eremiobacteraeota bacterium]
MKKSFYQYKKGNRFYLTLEIAGIRIRLESDYPLDGITRRKVYRDFIIKEENSPYSSLIEVIYGRLPACAWNRDNLIVGRPDAWSLYLSPRRIYIVYEKPDLRRKLFDSKNFKIFGRAFEESFATFKKDEAGLLPASIDFKEPKGYPPPKKIIDKVAVTDKWFRKSRIYMAESYENLNAQYEKKGIPFPDPLEKPFTGFMCSAITISHDGILLHSCGVADKNEGYVFIGGPSRGKSTMGEIWKDDSIVIHDDMIALMDTGDGFRMYPVPEVGNFVYNLRGQGVKVKRIMEIQPASHNQAERLRGLSAINILGSNTYRPFWNDRLLWKMVDNCAKVVRSIPIYHLGFKKSTEIIKFVRDMRE